MPKPGKDYSKRNGYGILTMQNIMGKLIELILSGKLAHDLERRNVLPPKQGEHRTVNASREKIARITYYVYEEFQELWPRLLI